VPEVAVAATGLVLYHTSGCHLCELAGALLEQLAREQGWHYRLVDIADSELLVDAYGTRIPVVRAERGGPELGWPFGREDLLRAFG